MGGLFLAISESPAIFLLLGLMQLIQLRNLQYDENPHLYFLNIHTTALDQSLRGNF